MGKRDHSKVLNALRRILNRKQVEDIALQCGFTKRRRKILPYELLLAALSVCARGRSGTFAEIWREYTLLTGQETAYKPFHRQLAKAEFEDFVAGVARIVMSELVLSANRPARRAIGVFDDILVQDGTSFSVHQDLRESFPKRFGHWGGEAAVEVHATMSLFRDQLCRLNITADSAPERPQLPSSAELRNKLIVTDRGYADYAWGAEVK